MTVDAVGRPGRTLLLGGTSEIGLATVRHLQLPPDGTVLLAGRDPERLAAAAGGLPCGSAVAPFDAADGSARRKVIQQAFADGDVDLILSAFGVLGDQAAAERDADYAEHLLEVNFVAHAGVLAEAAERLVDQGQGALVVFSSIAGVRARRPNYVYGSAKAGLDAFASGLADRLHGTGVRLLLVRPGFVIGRMTRGLPPAPLSRTVEDVGRRVARAVLRGEEGVLWIPPQLALLAAAMRVTPRRMWRRVPR
jgi:decaprenylphospho-beta-D-erythro-pentofuranosid-2-ulose 2-reductase